MMVSLVKGVERGLPLEEGIFLNNAKERKNDFSKTSCPFLSWSWLNSVSLIRHSGQSLALSLSKIFTDWTPLSSVTTSF
jgi:hypothetical protein